jgi:hypothetical protein
LLAGEISNVSRDVSGLAWHKVVELIMQLVLQNQMKT